MLLSAAAAWAFISFDTRGMTTQSPVMPVSVRIWWISSAARRSKRASIVVGPTQARDGEGRPPRRVELFGALSPAAGPTTGSIIGVAGMRARKVSPAFSPSGSTAEYLTPSTTNSILRSALTSAGTIMATTLVATTGI